MPIAAMRATSASYLRRTSTQKKIIKDKKIINNKNITFSNGSENMENCCVATNKGVFMGKRDVIKTILEEIALSNFGRVLIKLGKPLTVAATNNQTDRYVLAVPALYRASCAFTWQCL